MSTITTAPLRRSARVAALLLEKCRRAGDPLPQEKKAPETPKKAPKKAPEKAPKKPKRVPGPLLALLRRSGRIAGLGLETEEASSAAVSTPGGAKTSTPVANETTATLPAVSSPAASIPTASAPAASTPPVIQVKATPEASVHSTPSTVRTASLSSTPVPCTPPPPTLPSPIVCTSTLSRAASLSVTPPSASPIPVPSSPTLPRTASASVTPTPINPNSHSNTRGFGDPSSHPPLDVSSEATTSVDSTPTRAAPPPPPITVGPRVNRSMGESSASAASRPF
ncbi:hypothetical protein RUND412_000813 [Rhizina undulata]